MEVIAGMESIGLPCVYHKWPKAPPLPYTVILHTDNGDMTADNHNYLDIGNYRLELYTAIKQPPTEKKVEQWLKDHRILYEKTRSEERRVGKECRSRWSGNCEKKRGE